MTFDQHAEPGPCNWLVTFDVEFDHVQPLQVCEHCVKALRRHIVARIGSVDVCVDDSVRRIGMPEYCDD